MLIGVRIQNYCIFEDDIAGMLLEDVMKPQSVNSLASCAGVENESFPLAGLCAFIGRNKSGKTMFFSFLSYIRDAVMMGPAEAAMHDGKGGFVTLLMDRKRSMRGQLLFLFPKTMGFDEEKYCEYSFDIAADTHGKPYYKNESITIWSETMEKPLVTMDFTDGNGTVEINGKSEISEIDDVRYSALRAYGAISTYRTARAVYQDISHWFFAKFSNDEKGTHDKLIAPGGHKHLNTHGTNIQNVLDYMREENPQHFERVMNYLSAKIPRVGKVKDKLPDSFRNSPDVLFMYLLLLSDPYPRPLICMETPDSGLYHDMVDVLATEMRDYSVRYPYSQILFTTHNPYILESMAPDEVWVFKRSEEEENDAVDIESAASTPIVRELYEQGVGMGAIWYSGHFDEKNSDGKDDM